MHERIKGERFMKNIAQYKIYSIPKRWIVILFAIIMVNTVMLVGTTSSVNADTQSFTTDKAAVITENQEQVISTQEGVESSVAPTQAEETVPSAAFSSDKQTTEENNKITESEKGADTVPNSIQNSDNSITAEDTDSQNQSGRSSSQATVRATDIAANPITPATDGTTVYSKTKQASVTVQTDAQKSETLSKKNREEQALNQQDFVSGQQRITINRILDNKTSGISTLDAAALTYEFEKARLKGATDATIITEIQKTGKIIPSNLVYISDFYDNQTGTSGTAFKDKTSNKVIIAYTGTNNEGNQWQDALGADIMGIGLARGQHYQPAYDFYDKIASQYGVQNIVITGHSLGGNVAQRVALKKNSPTTVVYNSAPLYIPAIAYLGNKVYESLRKNFDLPSNKEEAKKTIADIKNDQRQFTGNVIRITTQKDWLNNIARNLGAVYLGKEHIIVNSGGHDLQGIVNDMKQVANVKALVSI